jgi:hypothetical protein
MREITFPPPGTARIPLIPPSALDDAGLAPVQRSSAGAAPAAAAAGPRPTADRARHAPLALARPPATPASLVEGSVPGPSVRRSVPGSITTHEPVVQTSRASGGGADRGSSGLPEFTVKPAVQREAAPAVVSGPSTGPVDAAASERELDQLAQQLFGRIRTRLRAEVIHEREARGLGFDAF